MPGLAAGQRRIIALLEPRSNTMRMGVHKDALAESLKGADRVIVFSPPDLDWDVAGAVAGLEHCDVMSTVEDIVATVVQEAKDGDYVLVMSNGAFGGIHLKLLDALKQQG